MSSVKNNYRPETYTGNPRQGKKGSGSLRGTDFLRVLHLLARRYRTRDRHVILDNSSTHKTPEVRAWQESHPRVHFHFPPTGASWWTMGEAGFGILPRQPVRRGSFDTVGALIKHIRHDIDRGNDNPTPFVWTQAPADIIQKALRRAHYHDFQDETLDVERRNRAKEIIEDFMIAANGVTARYLKARKYPSLRRVVRSPKRWERIVEVASRYGATLPPAPPSCRW